MSLAKVHYCKSQRGAALLMVMLVMITAFAFVYVTVVDVEDPKIAKEKLTQKALKQAKEALLGYLLTRARKDEPAEYVKLPCPDRVMGGAIDEGESDHCGSDKQNVLGRFPWRSLGLEALKDGENECLWYVLSSSFKTSYNSISNADSKGHLDLYASDDMAEKVNEDTAGGRIIAAIIAPGKAYEFQDRGTSSDDLDNVPFCGGNYDAYNYLEGKSGINNFELLEEENKLDALVNFATGDADGNDRIMYFTYQDIEQALTRRLQEDTQFSEDMNEFTAALAQCLVDYAKGNTAGDKRLPYPAPLVISSGDYGDDSGYDDDDTFPAGVAGRFPTTIDDSQTQVSNSSTSSSLLSTCNFFDPEPDPNPDLDRSKLWEDWKDHFFYAVAPSRHPGAAPDEDCDSSANCITINSSTATYYEAVVIFSGVALESLSQQRNQTPHEDTKQYGSNYLEDENNKDRNAISNNNFMTLSTPAINDILYCIYTDTMGESKVKLCSEPL